MTVHTVDEKDVKKDEWIHEVIYRCRKCNILLGPITGNDLNKAKSFRYQHNDDRLGQFKNDDCNGVTEYYSYKKIRINIKYEKKKEVDKNLEVEVDKNLDENDGEVHDGEIHENYKKLFQRPKRNIENIVLTKDINNAYNIAKKYLIEYPKRGLISEIRGIVLYGPTGTGKGVTMEIVENDPNFQKYCNFGLNAQIHEFTAEMRDTSEKIDNIIKKADNLAKKTGKRSIIFLDDMENVLGKRKGSSVQTKIARTSALLQHFGGKLDTPSVFLFLGTNLPEEVDFAFKNRFKWCGYHLFEKEERKNFIKHCFSKYSNNGCLDYDKLNEYTEGHWDARVFQQLNEHLEFEFGDVYMNGESISNEQSAESLARFKLEFETERKERELATEDGTYDSNHRYGDKDVLPFRQNLILERISKEDREYILTTGKWAGSMIEDIIKLDLQHLDWIANPKQKLHPDHDAVKKAIGDRK